MALNVDININYKKLLNNNLDPDKYCKELGETHCILWSSKKTLGILKWNSLNKLKSFINGIEFIFTPDSIVNSFYNSKRIIKGKGIKESDWIRSLSKMTQDIIKDYRNIDYTIGSSIIFPISINGKSIGWTMNKARGCSSKIHDRFDYTLECIKRYYEENIDNPLQSAIEKSSLFFNLFKSFNEYVDFFFLNDLVDEKGNVISFTDKIDFSSPFPKTEEEYIKYLDNTIRFVNKRNERILTYCNKYMLD